MSSAHQFLQAARVPHSLQQQSFGKWAIHRHPYSSITFGWNDATFLSRKITVPVDMSNIHLSTGGDTIETWDTVMEDTSTELKRHLPIWIRAKGRILITGLGLGCVVRGLLASTAVEHVDVIEIDPDIHAIVGEEFFDNPRVTLHFGDALKYDFPKGSGWDFAWHDIWTPKNDGLSIKHARLMRRFHNRVKHAQGAWAFPRSMKRLYCAKMGDMLR